MTGEGASEVRDAAFGPRPSFWLRRLAPPVLLFTLWLAGCTRPTTYTRPRVAHGGGKTFLVTELLSPGEEGARFALRISEDGDLSSWGEEKRFLGRVVALLAEHGGVTLVYEDGAVQWRETLSGDPKVLARPDPRRSLLAASRVSGDLLAAELRGDALRLLALHDGDWSERDPALPVLGTPRAVRMATVDGAPVVAWRRVTAGVMEPGLLLWQLGKEGWSPLPAPPGAPRRSPYDIASGPSGLLLVRPPLLDETPRDAFQVLRYDGERWKRIDAAPRLAGVWTSDHILGLAMGRMGDGVALVQSNPSGVYASRSGPDGGSPWTAPEEVVAQDTGELGTLLLLVFFLLIGLGAVALHRLRLRRRVESGPSTDLPALAPRPGGPASAMERSLAILLDMLLVFSFPLAFYGGGGGTSTMAWEGKGLEPLLVWIAGMALYGAVSESLWGQTLGKRLFRLRVRRVEGGRIRPLQGVARNLCRMIDFFPVPLGDMVMPYLVALVFVVFTPRRQRLGDLLAGTVVRRYTPLARRSIILGSSSPRRRDLLEAAGLRFGVVSPLGEERLRDDWSPEQTALELSRAKAADVADRLAGMEIVIAADTIVVCDNEILGKPRDAEEAKAMLRRLAGRSHRVLTGVAVIDRASGQSLSGVESTEVVFRDLAPFEIDAYVASGEADGKAGAYAIQESADRFVTEVRGSLSNVIGLPMEMLRSMLDELDG